MDDPEDAALFEMQLEFVSHSVCTQKLKVHCNRSGDIVILGTDGFSDNVHKGELEQITKLVLEHQVRDSLSDEATMDRLALACVNYARLCSFKVFFKSTLRLSGQLTRPSRRRTRSALLSSRRGSRASTSPVERLMT